jgi:hypothetical protein
MSFLKAAGLFPFLSPEHHNYPNYYHHRNPRSPYDIDRSPVWYVQKLCHHYCEPANHPPRFALSFHGVRRVGRFNALALLKSRGAEASLAFCWDPVTAAAHFVEHFIRIRIRQTRDSGRVSASSGNSRLPDCFPGRFPESQRKNWRFTVRNKRFPSSRCASAIQIVRP